MNEQNMERCCPCPCEVPQFHTHEYLGSTRIAGPSPELQHNHRFAGVTSQAILLGNGNHVHKLSTNTDFYEIHFHAVCETTGEAIPVGEGRHVHFVQGHTTINAQHLHELIFATLIDNPIGD